MRKKKSKVMKSRLVAAWYKERTGWVKRRKLCHAEWGIITTLKPGPLSSKLIAMYAKKAIKTKKTK